MRLTIFILPLVCLCMGSSLVVAGTTNGIPADVAIAQAKAKATAPIPGLDFDATTKEYTAKPGEMNAEFTFAMTNSSPNEITINSVRTSCGCTTAKLPPMPWKLAPGTSGEFSVSADLRGKWGTFSKFVTVDTSMGTKLLNVRVEIPGDGPRPGMDSRTRNMQLAMADRQVVFRGQCASCHSTPAVGKKGEALFQVACAICHEAPHRASMVPDLKEPKNPPTAEYWRAWITAGRAGSLMPAFAQTQGGPLTNEQIESLVEYLTHYFPPRSPTAEATPRVDD
ncbi:MAG: DUF1573 domain-containing protein [Verrucomicrobiota bacterium]|nr:DUF1573 domain-containing protein [Verrucomicrobiota bacterium]